MAAVCTITKAMIALIVFLCCFLQSAAFITPRLASSALRRTPTSHIFIFNSASTTSVGIDLGTTYSLVSLLENGRPKIIKVDGKPTMPSVVSYLPNGRVVVGHAARDLDASNPLNTFTSIKRIMGKPLEYIQKMREKVFTSKIRKNAPASPAVLAANPEAHLFCPALQVHLSPEQVSAEILRKLVHIAEKHLQERDGASAKKITNAVITVPAYFDPLQREATTRAGKLIGLEKVKLLREPEAAALAYGVNLHIPQLVLVFDLGGGTLDVSALEVGGGVVEVIATSGDAHLGGDDFDAVIVEHVLEQFAQVPGVTQEILSSVRGDASVLATLRATAEEAKRNLSSVQQVTIDCPVLHKQSGLGVSVELTRRRFETLSTSLLFRLLQPVRELALVAGINLPGESGQIGMSRAEELEDQEEQEEEDEHLSEEEIEAAQHDATVKALRIAQTTGRAEARARQKAQAPAQKELRRLQKIEDNTNKMKGISTKSHGGGGGGGGGKGGSKLRLFPGGRAIDAVLLVGGSTRLPCVKRAVQRITGVEALPTGKVNPDEAVCLGAGVMAGMLDGTLPDMKVISPWQTAILKAVYDEKVKGNPMMADYLPLLDRSTDGVKMKSAEAVARESVPEVDSIVEQEDQEKQRKGFFKRRAKI